MFFDNSCDGQYGGGIGLWSISSPLIQFNDWTFIENIGLSPNTHRFNQKPVEGDYYPGDGGALQFCFSNTIHNVDMTFLRCYFLQNKAVWNGGALALQTIKRVDIINCTFDENLADYKVDQSA